MPPVFKASSASTNLFTNDFISSSENFSTLGISDFTPGKGIPASLLIAIGERFFSFFHIQIVAMFRAIQRNKFQSLNASSPLSCNFLAKRTLSLAFPLPIKSLIFHTVCFSLGMQTRSASSIVGLSAEYAINLRHSFLRCHWSLPTTETM